MTRETDDKTGRLPFDRESQQLARVYAAAFLGAAESEGQLDVALKELDDFLQEVIRPHPDFGEFLRSGFISREDKDRVLRNLLKDQASSLLLRFLLVLNQHDRLDILRSIVRACHEQLDQRRGRIPVEVITAVPLDEDLRNRVHDDLRRLLRREPVLSTQVNRRLLGGMVLRVGDRVYDGSVATQLRRLHDYIVQRSVYAIQSRRDRFRDSEGD